jgi:hypothetical protein
VARGLTAAWLAAAAFVSGDWQTNPSNGPVACPLGCPMSEVRLMVAAVETAYRRWSDVRLLLALTNDSSHDLLVLSHYEVPGRRDFDHVEIHVQDPRTGRRWSLTPSGVRKAVAKVWCALDPGESLRLEIPFGDWARRQALRLPDGAFRVSATYQVSSDESAVSEWVRCASISERETPDPTPGRPRPPWTGSLETAPALLRVGP